MSSRAWRTQRGARGLLAVAVLVLAVVTPHTIVGAGIDREAARSRALQFARSKFEYVVANMRVADPLYDVIRAGFCRGAHELDVADVCGRGSPTSRVFVVDVLSVSHTRIIDVVAVSDTSTYSLREPAGFQRWVSNNGGNGRDGRVGPGAGGCSESRDHRSTSFRRMQRRGRIQRE